MRQCLHKSIFIGQQHIKASHEWNSCRCSSTGNDTRGAEASAHAYAARDGQYRGMATWKYDKARGRLVGTMEVPMTLAIVGGGTKVLLIAKAF